MAEYPAAIIRTSSLKWFKKCPEIIRLAVMYVRFPRSLRDVGGPAHDRGGELSHETVRFWWHRFGPMFASEIRKRRIGGAWNPAAGDGTSTRCS